MASSFPQEEVMSEKDRFGTLLAPLALLFACVAAGGCASQSSAPPRSPAEDATAFRQTRCSEFTDDKAVANILSGKSVEGVSALYNGAGGRGGNAHLEGATVYVRPGAGQTAEWLDRALECHSAKRTSEAAGFAATNDPFFLPDSRVTIRVQSANDSFRVDIEGASTADAREILARANAFAGVLLPGGRSQEGLATQPALP
jgi:hypothetical protein